MTTVAERVGLHPDQTTRQPTWIRIVGRIVELLGALGVLLGILGAATFAAMPDLLPPEYAGLRWALVGVSAAGIAASILGFAGGRGVLKGREAARRIVLGAGVTCVALLAVISWMYPVSNFLAYTAIPAWGLVLILSVAVWRRPIA